MATIDRPPLFTRVHSRDPFAALQTSLLRGSSRALLSAIVVNPFANYDFPNPVQKAFSAELRTFLSGATVPELISVLPASGFGWSETPQPRQVQQPEIARNVALLGQPVVQPFSQTAWPNPIPPDRFAYYRGFDFRNAQTSAPLVGPPLVGANYVSWANPTQPPKDVYRMSWLSGTDTLQLTPPPISLGTSLRGLYIGIRIGF
jgi:hypothetical protein